MKHILIGALLTVSALAATSGCAALFSESKSNVTMNSDPGGAEVWVDGIRMGTTPMMIPLDKTKEHSITFRRPGYEPTTCLISTSVAVGWVILDALGGVLPIVVDGVTGSWKKLDRTHCHGTLRRQIARPSERVDERSRL